MTDTRKENTLNNLVDTYRETGDYAPFASAASNIFRAELSRLGARGEDLEDLDQEAHVKLWKTIETLDTSRSVVKYLRQIARNVFLDNHKAGKCKKRDTGYIDYLLSLPSKKVENFFN
jgi:DNA-directed RNA polymerase specialized sigma24 family protein